jgi:DNA-binding transcriptional regulator YbjK
MENQNQQKQIEDEQETQLKQHLAKKLELLEQEKNRIQIEQTNSRFRENQTKLLTEFVDYSISKGYGSAYDQKELIESFLDERSKNND